MIPGLKYIPAYLSPTEETELLAIIDAGAWITDLKRRVQHFGYVYDYKQRTVDPTLYLGALPDWAQAVAERLQREGCAPAVPDQVIVNEYLPGQGIAPHVDCVPCFGDTILSLSLGSACVMDFTPVREGSKVSLLLEPCSLVVMQGEARYQWKHGIAPRKTDLIHNLTIPRRRRVSLTLRKVIA